MPLDLTSLGPGDLVAERYRLEAEIGRGGFGIVFRAIQLPIQRPVALKVIHPRAASHPRALQRFYREAEIARRLHHPNTVSLLDFGQTDEGIPFIAWELLQGRSLGAALEEDGPFSLERTRRVGLQACRSLMEAHALGFIHRDIKPANLFLCDFAGERDFVKVLDFGVATGFDPDRHSLQRLTTQGQVLGTPYYTAPEMILNRPLSPAVDIYALGLVLAELLCGRVVMQAERKMEVYFQHIHEAPVPLPPEVLATPFGPLLTRAVLKDPAGRFPDAAALHDALDALSLAVSAPAFAPASAPPDPRATLSTVFDLAPDQRRRPAPPATVLDLELPPEAVKGPAPQAAPQAAQEAAALTPRGFPVWLLLLLLIPMAAAVGLGVAAIVLGGVLAKREAPQDHPEPPAATPAARRATRRAPSDPGKLVRARLDAAHYEILAYSVHTQEQSGFTTHTWSVQDNGPQGGFNSLILLIYPDADLARAQAAESSRRLKETNLVESEGRLIFMVLHDGTPKGIARAQRVMDVARKRAR